MKTIAKKSEIVAPVHQPGQQQDKKQSSGDKQFDEAIDRMLRPRPQTTQTK